MESFFEDRKFSRNSWLSVLNADYKIIHVDLEGIEAGRGQILIRVGAEI